MSEAATKRYIDDIGRHLFAPLLRPPRPGASWRLVSWDAEQGLCLTVARGRTLLLIELEERNEERDCYTRTERFNICVRRQFEGQTPLDEGDRKLVERIAAMVRQREKLLPDLERAASTARKAVRPILVDRVLIPEGRGHYYINPYVGCAIGCDFCYIAERADLSRRLEGLPHAAWGRYVDVKVNAAEILREEAALFPPGIVRLSPLLTDPYQPVERKWRITRQCLEVLLDTGFAPAILTRAARVMEDIDLLRKFERAAVGFSIPSDDDRYRLIFEPGGDPIERRLEALEALHAAGINTFAVIQPILPMDVDRLVDRVAPLIRAVRFDRMHFIPLVRHLYERHGLDYAMTDTFFEEMEGRLAEAFAAHGIPYDEMDEMARLVART